VTLGAHSPLSRRTGSQSYTRPRGTNRRGRPPKFSAGAPPVLATGRTSWRPLTRTARRTDRTRIEATNSAALEKAYGTKLITAV